MTSAAPPRLTESIEVQEPIQWGKLIKTWATGKNYFANEGIPSEKLTVPQSLEELVKQARIVGAGLTIPTSLGLKVLVVIPASNDTLVIKLPPKKMIEQHETELDTGDRYPFPAFYSDYVGRKLTRAEKREAHACRIGDYTISQCG